MIGATDMPLQRADSFFILSCQLLVVAEDLRDLSKLGVGGSQLFLSAGFCVIRLRNSFETLGAGLGMGIGNQKLSKKLRTILLRMTRQKKSCTLLGGNCY